VGEQVRVEDVRIIAHTGAGGANHNIGVLEDANEVLGTRTSFAPISRVEGGLAATRLIFGISTVYPIRRSTLTVSTAT
jgi:hypothetical protein